MDLAPLVVDELRVLGSRCGPFRLALESGARHRYPVRRLVSGRYPLARAAEAFAAAASPSSLEVLLDPSAAG